VKRDLRNAILNAEDGLLVRDIVQPAVLDRLPLRLARSFANMRIEWLPSRIWGESFQVGDRVVRLGHRRGDHVATHPHLYGLSETEAERLLLRWLEGTLLHELGHAVFDAALAREDWMPKIERCLALEGPLSTYLGQEELPHDDMLHEAFAEAFRYWCFDDLTLIRRFKAWHALVKSVVSSLPSLY
jgi:hypothetical protein